MLAGMYRWDPHGGFHDVVWTGTLVVEPPCVYLKDIVPVPELASQPSLWRSYLRLPEPLTRYDPATGEVWVAGNGPMVDGDAVKVFGSEGWRLEWGRSDGFRRHTFEDFLSLFSLDRPGCTARFSYWAASMSPADAADPYVPATSRLDGLELFDWAPDQGWRADSGTRGILVIEPPCVYFDLVGVADHGVDWDMLPRLDEPIRLRLRLVRPLVRYDPYNNTLSYRTEGPIASGDEVYGSGGGGRREPDGPNELCPAAGEYTAAHMGPRPQPQ